jgi:cephalosporin hydroxylase
MTYPERTIDVYRQRLARHTQDTPYRGRALNKFPEDLRVYQTIIEAAQPDTILEVGSYDGGSALWFADQLRALTIGGQVISIDINPVRPVNDPDVTFIHGNAIHPDTINHVRGLAGTRVMVIEDSAHTYPVTKAVLNAYAGLVTPGQWFVVEDGVVDIEELRLPGWPRGVTPALEEFLATPTGKEFKRYHFDQYTFTCHPGGWLRKER